MAEDASRALRERLKSLRKVLRWTQEDLAERAALNYKHYQEIERGAKVEVRLSTLVKLARALGVPMYQLFTDEPAASVVAESTAEYRAKPAAARANSAGAKKPPAAKNPPPQG